LTSLAVELEQRRLLATEIERADAAVVAFGQSVSAFADAATFGASRDSLLDPNADLDAEPPPIYAERGLPWPTRMAAESFIAYGVFPQDADARALARLNGVVLAASRRTTAHTAQSFIVARVRTAGFEVDLCMSAEEHPEVPTPGQVVGGEVFLVGSIPNLEQPTTAKRWWRRK
jgi:hypothetical protein